MVRKARSTSSKPAAAPVVTAVPSAPAPQPRAAPRRTEPATTVPVLQQTRPPCVYKPVMTDEEIRKMEEMSRRKEVEVMQV